MKLYNLFLCAISCVYAHGRELEIHKGNFAHNSHSFTIVCPHSAPSPETTTALIDEKAIPVKAVTQYRDGHKKISTETGDFDLWNPQYDISEEGTLATFRGAPVSNYDFRLVESNNVDSKLNAMTYAKLIEEDI